MKLSDKKQYYKYMNQLDDIIMNCINNNYTKTIDQHNKIMELIELCKKYSKNWNSNILYLLYSPELDLLKIGITNNIDERLRSIKNQMKLNQINIIQLLPNYSFLESTIHKKFKHLNNPIKLKQLHREWFKNDQSIINEFKN